MSLLHNQGLHGLRYVYDDESGYTDMGEREVCHVRAFEGTASTAIGRFSPRGLEQIPRESRSMDLDGWRQFHA